MHTLLLRFLAVGLLLGASLASAQQQPQQWVEGKHYFEIKPAQRGDAPAAVIEVTEFFSYGCVFCNRAIPMMDQLKKSLPANARMNYVPASFNSAESWPLFQRVYYTANALGLIPKMHNAVYSAVWTSNELAVTEPDGRRLKSPQPTLDDAAKFFAKKAGIQPEQFIATARSFSVEAQCRRADQLVKLLKVDSTPTLIVNGRYRVSSTMLREPEQMIALVNWLVAKEAGSG